MIHALLQYARDQKLTSEPGFKTKEIRWLLLFSKTGEFLNVHRLGEGKAGEMVDGCPDLSQPELKGGGAGCRHFLVDNLNVVTLWTKGDDDPDDKLKAKNRYFIDLLNQAAEAVPPLGPIAASLAADETRGKIHQCLQDASPKPSPTDNATVAMIDAHQKQVRFVDADDWRDWWRGFRTRLGQRKAEKKPASKSEASEASLMRCLLSGELVSPAPTHPKISGLSDVGGMSAGDVLISFKQDAFSSFGLEQAANAAMSAEMATVYADALNHLLRNQAERLAGAKVVYWYSGKAPVPGDLDPILRLKEGGITLDDDDDEDEEPGSPDESASEAQPSAAQLLADRLQAVADARSLLTAIKNANRQDLLNSRFQAMTLSGNSGRVIVRDWMEGQFEQLAKAVDEWFEDLRIIRRDGKTYAHSPKFLAVLGCLVRDLKDISPPLETALWRSALGGSSRLIPYQAMAMAIARLRIDLIDDTPPNHARYGLLRAYCLRNQGISMTPELDETLKDPAYLSGRILAILGDIQRAANPNVDVGVVQRYYGAASTTPALVLGRLVQLANKAHLPQIKDGLRQWFDQRLTNVWAQLQESPPRVLTLEEQTLFALGFYHQKAKRKADEKPPQATTETSPPKED